VVLDSNLLWGGSEGVIAVMRQDPQLKGIPVLLVVNRPSTSPMRHWGELSSLINLLPATHTPLEFLKRICALTGIDLDLIADQAARKRLHSSNLTELRSLDIKETGDEVIITGKVSTFYLKQMAQETVRPCVIGRRLLNNIVVKSAGKT